MMCFLGRPGLARWNASKLRDRTGARPQQSHEIRRALAGTALKGRGRGPRDAGLRAMRERPDVTGSEDRQRRLRNLALDRPAGPGRCGEGAARSWLAYSLRRPPSPFLAGFSGRLSGRPAPPMTGHDDATGRAETRLIGPRRGFWRASCRVLERKQRSRRALVGSTLDVEERGACARTRSHTVKAPTHKTNRDFMHAFGFSPSRARPLRPRVPWRAPEPRKAASAPRSNPPRHRTAPSRAIEPREPTSRHVVQSPGGARSRIGKNPGTRACARTCAHAYSLT
ncbi:MAG: hypothetical protein QOE90_12, partial [Thermoplasmata archaeon]|nr:hypothetical protein [Thermoplasmata archaeon]